MQKIYVARHPKSVSSIPNLSRLNDPLDSDHAPRDCLYSLSAAVAASSISLWMPYIISYMPYS
jgi:hypothetical protein